MRHYTYFLLLLVTLSYPLLKSFESRVRFYKKWKYLFPSILITALIFIAGDIWFVILNIWWFNPAYITGFHIFNLPIEECLFFFIVPFSCMFIYEVLYYFIPKNILAKASIYITIILCLFLFSFAIIYHDRFYTLVVFASLAMFLVIHQFVFKTVFLSRFYLLWIFAIFPFLLFDGIVTGMPITIYNNSQAIGVRIVCIPLEDLFYGMLQLLLIITIYEWLKKRETTKP